MSEFLQQLLVNIGGNAILAGLVVYLGRIYLERIGRNEQAAIDERLKKLEQEHESLIVKGEHFHQISQATYQKLFDKKIDTYSEAWKICTNLENYVEQYNYSFKTTGIKNTKNFDEINIYFEGLLKLLNDNFLVLSIELQLILKDLNLISMPVITDFFYRLDSNDPDESLSDVPADTLKNLGRIGLTANLIFNNPEKLNKLINQIGIDISHITKYLQDVDVKIITPPNTQSPSA